VTGWSGKTKIMTIALLVGLSAAAAEEAPDRATERSAPEAPPLNIRLMPKMAQGPATVQVLVQVDPHPDNRKLRVAIDSEDHYRSTDIQLEGGEARRHHFVVWQAVPPGEYVCVATVYGPGGDRSRLVRQDRFLIVK
jgi:hypothetical protein